MSKWISVKDRLPDDDSMILFGIEGRDWGVGFYMPKGRSLKDGFWRHIDNVNIEMLEDITHWKPLPISPEPDDFGPCPGC